jgi:hypothetical protein
MNLDEIPQSIMYASRDRVCFICKKYFNEHPKIENSEINEYFGEPLLYLLCDNDIVRVTL